VALPIVIAKNQTVGDINLTRLGLVVPASGQITLTDSSCFFEIGSDESLNTAVGSGDIVINDGSSDLSTAEALAYLDTTGNLNGPVTGASAGKLLRLLDATGRYTEAAGVVVYDPSTTDPTSPSPSNGDLYYNTALNLLMAYDSTRTKWLSVVEGQISFGRYGTTGDGAYYRGADGLSYSSTRGRSAEFNGTVVGISYTRGETSSATFEATASGSTVADLVSTAVAGSSTALDGVFSQGDILGARNAEGGADTSNVQGWITFRWRV